MRCERRQEASATAKEWLRLFRQHGEDRSRRTRLASTIINDPAGFQTEGIVYRECDVCSGWRECSPVRIHYIDLDEEQKQRTTRPVFELAGGRRSTKPLTVLSAKKAPSKT